MSSHHSLAKTSNSKSPNNSLSNSRNSKSDNNSEKSKPEGPHYEPVQESGLLNVGIGYNSLKSQLELTILNVKNIPTKDRGAPPIIQVRLLLLPARVRRWKTKVQNTDHRVFNEVFRMRHISTNELDHLGIRFRLYGIGKVKDRLIGEAVIDLGELNLPQYFSEDSRNKLLERTRNQYQNQNQTGAGSALPNSLSRTSPATPNHPSHKNNNNKSMSSSSLSLNNNSSNSQSNSNSYQSKAYNQPYSNTNNVRSSNYSVAKHQAEGLAGGTISEAVTNFSSSSHVNLTLTIKLDPRANLIDKPSLESKQCQVVAHGAPKEAAVIYNSSLTIGGVEYEKSIRCAHVCLCPFALDEFYSDNPPFHDSIRRRVPPNPNRPLLQRANRPALHPTHQRFPFRRPSLLRSPQHLRQTSPPRPPTKRSLPLQIHHQRKYPKPSFPGKVFLWSCGKSVEFSDGHG